MNHEHVVVTGAAGFIGSHLCEALLSQGYQVAGVDGFLPNYAEAFKRNNLHKLLSTERFSLLESAIADEHFQDLLHSVRPGAIIHLAATPGVRPSISQVLEYVDNNVRGTANVLASAVAAGVPKVIFASSSSVYGQGLDRPSREDDATTPLSPYAATKVAGEALCRSFVACHDISITCLRFFTAYGPRQRPDMAIHKLARCIKTGTPFRVHGSGTSMRDYTYISDIVSGICAALVYEKRFSIFNLGSGRPIELREMISTVSEAIGSTPTLEFEALSSAEPLHTYADIHKASTALGFHPQVGFRDGIKQFAEWFEQMWKSETA